MASYGLGVDRDLEDRVLPGLEFHDLDDVLLAQDEGRLSMDSPYRTAGTKPCFRRRREAFVPSPWRFSLLTTMFILFSLSEEGAHRAPLVDPPDGLSEELGDGKDGEFAGGGGLFRQRYRIGHEDAFQLRFLDPVEGRARQDGMGAGAEDPLGALFGQGVRR